MFLIAGHNQGGPNNFVPPNYNNGGMYFIFTMYLLKYLLRKV